MKTKQRKRVNKSKTKDCMFRPSVLVVAGVTAVMVLAMSIETLDMQAQVREYDEVIQELEERKVQEELRTQEIEEFEVYTGTDEYIEEVAREKLGMVYPDEYILTATK